MPEEVKMLGNSVASIVVTFSLSVFSRLCSVFDVSPTYCLLHRLHVMRKMTLCEWQMRLCRMIYLLRVVVEVNIVDDVKSVHVKHLGMLHDLLPTVSRLDADDSIYEPRRFFWPAEICHGECRDSFFAPI